MTGCGTRRRSHDATRGHERALRRGLQGVRTQRSRGGAGVAQRDARGGDHAFRPARLPHDEARGVALHERGADRRDDVHVEPRARHRACHGPAARAPVRGRAAGGAGRVRGRRVRAEPVRRGRPLPRRPRGEPRSRARARPRARPPAFGALCALSGEPLRRPEHGVPVRRRVRVRARGRGVRSADRARVRGDGGRRAYGVAPEEPRGRGARGASDGGRELRRARGWCVLDQRRDRGGGRRWGATRALPAATREPTGLSRRHHACDPGPGQRAAPPPDRLGRGARPPRCAHGARGERRGADPERVLPAPRQPALGPSHGDRSRAAALRQPRVLQRDRGRAGSRRVQRPDHRAAGRPADGLEADQQQPPALDRGPRGQPAAARDLRRRCEVHARLDRGPARPDSPLLPAKPWPLAGDRGGHADLRLRRRDPGPDGAHGAAGGARPGGEGPPGRPLARGTEGVMLDAARCRADFPLLQGQEHGHRLVYLDNAATTQKPQAGLAAILDYYRTTNANVHRGAYGLAIGATDASEAARERVARFLDAWGPEGVGVTPGTTEAINQVAGAYGRANLRQGDTVVVTAMDHHSNLVPWQILCHEKGAVLRMVEITEDGRIDLSDYGQALERRPENVALPYGSDSPRAVKPAGPLIRLAHAVGAVVVVDGAQSTPHLKVDVQALDCDFYACSGHKMLGPMGSGALVAKPALLEVMPPYHGGGEMISKVWDDHSTYNTIPHKFEAGTPNVEGAVR